MFQRSFKLDIHTASMELIAPYYSLIQKIVTYIDSKDRDRLDEDDKIKLCKVEFSRRYQHLGNLLAEIIHGIFTGEIYGPSTRREPNAIEEASGMKMQAMEIAQRMQENLPDTAAVAL